MRFVSQAFERVRALLSGPRKPSAHSLSGHPVHQAPVYAVQPQPETWGAALAFACLCRDGGGPAPLDAGHPLVRAYVLPPDERQRALSVRQFTGVS